ncbi:MAG: hypothetical protein IJF78_17095 [Clostridia bacterium]|nr:hypothetical protein [Clostridia bacterium]
MSQRIESFVIEVKTDNGTYSEVPSGTTVGYPRIAKFNTVLFKFRIS